MNDKALAGTLNLLLATERRSLARHALRWRMHRTPRTYPVARSIEAMAERSAAHEARLSALMDQLDLPERATPFAATVAHYHDVDVESLLPRLIEEKQRQVQSYEQAIEHVGSDAAVVGELEQLLAENREQLQALERSARQLAAT